MNKHILSILATTALLLSATSILLQVRESASAAPLAQLAAVPRVINYQGRLTDAAGNPLTGSYPMAFALYVAPTGGAALWTETQNVAVDAGIFDVLLGKVTPIPASAFANTDLYLGVRVGGDAEMTPRRKVVSVGYAYRAEDAANADTLDNLDSTAFARADQAVPAGAIIIWSSATCPAGWSRVNELDSKFLVSDSLYNPAAGGSNTHAHAAGTYVAANHTHTINTQVGTPVYRGNSHYLGVTTEHGGGVWGDQYEKNRYGTASETLNTSSSGEGAIAGASALADSRPEFATVLLCRKD